MLKSLSLTGTRGVYVTGASVPNIELDQNGGIICNDFQLDNESGNGFKCYGVNTACSRMLTSSITQNGAMTRTSFAMVNNTAGESNTNMTISQTSDIECVNINCSSVLLNSVLWQPTIETVV